MAFLSPKVVGPHDQPSDADVAVSRTAAHKAGVAARPGPHRNQSAHVDAGTQRFADEFAEVRERHNGGPWADAPEVKSRQQAKAEIDPEQVAMLEIAAAQSARADEAEARLAEVHEDALNGAAYGTDFEQTDPATLAEIGDALLVNDGTDPGRFSSFVSQWGHYDPRNGGGLRRRP